MKDRSISVEAVEFFREKIVKNLLSSYQEADEKNKYKVYNKNYWEKPKNLILVKSANTIQLINPEGISFGQIELPFNEVVDIYVNTNHSGKTFVAIIDGLENNVYLYDSKGELLNSKSLEGQSKVHLVVSDHKQITTIIDQFIIQYSEK